MFITGVLKTIYSVDGNLEIEYSYVPGVNSYKIVSVKYWIEEIQLWVDVTNQYFNVNDKINEMVLKDMAA